MRYFKLIAPEFPYADEVAAMWSKNTGMMVTVVDEAEGPGTIRAVHVEGETKCGSGGGLSGYGGCASGASNGEFLIEIPNYVKEAYGLVGETGSFKHEVGHCLGGMGWHPKNVRSIMHVPMDPRDPPRGPTSEDRAYLRTIAANG